MKISVFGLGYVGSVSVAGLADLGHEVIGVDVNPAKVDAINSGASPVVEAGLDEIIRDGVRSGRIRAISNVQEAVAHTEISLICVGTPGNGNGNQDLTFVKRVCEEIGAALANKKDYHVVAVRSTVLPGTTEEQLIPILERASGGRAGQDFGVVFNPEFLREGTALQDFHNPPFTIVGESEPHATEFIQCLYEALQAPFVTVPLRTAEMVKFVSNSFHALKVVFANEIGNICKREGIDSHQVMDIVCMDTKLNISSYYLKPGFAFGGSCLPKDVKALLHHAHHLDLDLPLLEAILPSNDLQVKQAFEMIKETECKKVGVLGFSFKEGTDDLRNSPQVELIESLLGKGYRVKVYDRNVSYQRLHGANRAFIDREIPHLANLMCDTVGEVIDDSEVIVIGNKSAEFNAALQHVRPDQTVIDLARVPAGTVPPHVHYEGISW